MFQNSNNTIIAEDCLIGFAVRRIGDKVECMYSGLMISPSDATGCEIAKSLAESLTNKDEGCYAADVAAAYDYFVIEQGWPEPTRENWLFSDIWNEFLFPEFSKGQS